MMRNSWKVFASANRARVHRAGLCCTVLFLFLLASALCAFGQDATIVGSITDPSGASVVGAEITITASATGQVRHFVSSSQGEYVAPGIQVGLYTIRVEAKGFKAVERKDVTLQVGDRARLDFQMQVGTNKETVTVEATAVAVQSDTSEISQVVSGEQLAHLGTNGRSMYTFLNMTTGAANLQGDSQAPTPSGGDATVSFNGNRPVHNLYMIDGGEDADRGGGGTTAVMPSLEAIGEFRTLTSNYDAEYGLSSAATMTSVIKSGASKLHGSAWESFRNDALDAKNHFQGSKGELRHNIFGFNVSGPIDYWKKDHKSFFFYNMEWRKEIKGGQVNHDVPSLDWYPDANGAGTGAILPGTINVPTAAQVDPTILFANCPGGVAPAGISQGSTFPANTIPDCMIAGNATALLKAGIFPANNSLDSSGNPSFTGGANAPTNVREEIVRIDHTFNDKFSVFGHFIAESVMQTFATTMWSGDNMPTIGNTFGNPSYSAVVHTLHTIRPNLLNEIAFNYSGNRINILPKGTPALLAPSDYTYNKVFPGTNPNIPTISLSGGTGANYDSNWTPWINKYNDYQLRDDISWTKGSHQLKMGGSWALYAKQQDVFASTQGHFTFDGSFSGDSFADYLLGYAQDYQEDAIHDHGNWNAVSWAAYFQDNWRVNKKLTLNLGLRWDGVPHTYEKNKRMSSFYANLYDPAAAATFNSAGNICRSAADPGCTAASPGLGTSSNPILAGTPLYLNGIGIGGLGGVPRGMVNNHWAAFGPRIGFAYDLTGQGKTVIRGGFGIMYERVQGNDMYDAATNVPADAHAQLNVGGSGVLFQNPNTVASNGSTAIAPIVATSITGFDPVQYKLPISTQYSIGVEQGLGARAVLSISYVGNQNRHQNFYQEINMPDLADVPALLAGTSPTPYNQLVQYPGFHSIRLARDSANSHYNSLQTSVRGHVARDLELQAGWTYSKAVDPTTGGGNGFDLDNVSNPYAGWKFDQGPSVFDRRNVLFVNWTYDIPLFRNSSNKAAKVALGGWQLSSIVSIMSGAPLNITQGGSTASSVVPNSSVRPDLTGSISYPHKVNEWFDPSAFSAPAAGTWGNLPHDALIGPGRDNWNMTLFKNFNFTERARLEFRVDAFNVFNHTQWVGNVQQGGIDTNTADGSFGAVNSAYDPRTLQLGLKLVF
jgi:hypothetical protein